MKIKSRIKKLEKQMSCGHVWEPRRGFFMGEYFLKKCWVCGLEVCVSKEEFASLNAGVAKRVRAELKEAEESK